ncbi:MAG: bifunctional NUDIX hydrolase family protein/GNAT family N-acetyltransferase [Acidimicrobiales bacterium]
MGNHEDLVVAVRDAVAARTPVDARERASIAAFVQQLDGLERPFDEHASKVHVTGSAIVVAETPGKGVVLHQHKRLGLWLQPGGHIEPGETPWEGALREAAEETGLPVSFGPQGPQLVHVDVHPGPRGHTHLDLRYLVQSPAVPPRPPEGESQQVQWFPWHRAIAIAEPGLEGVLRALQPGEPSLRPARSNDAGDLAHVYLRSREFGLPEVPCIHAPNEVKAWFADEVIGHAEVIVAEVDGTAVGLLVLEPGARGTGWIEQLYVDPAWIGRGLGRRLLERAMHRFPAGLQLWTFEVNSRARRFYERFGFTVAEATDGRGNEERAPDVRYVWAPTG